MSDPAGVYTLLGLPLTAVAAEAAANQNATGPVTYLLAGALGTFDLASNVDSTVVVDQVVTVADVVNVITDGGTIVAGTGLLLDTLNAYVSGGGDYVVGGTGLISLLSFPGTVNFINTGGTLTLGTAGTLAATSETGLITGFNAPLDQIDDRSLQFSGITGYDVTDTTGGTQTVTVIDSSGDFSFVTDGAGLAAGAFALGTGPLTFTAAADGSTILGAICFLRGTHIATPSGETRVEALREGDMVATRAGGRTVFRPVTWVGRRAIDVSRMRGVDAHPVRIRAGAFADGVPHRDLLVTPEHCVHIGERLVPARMLVNGGSIISDTGIGRYEFFHVELEHHAILVAEGLETESYLDTGNRGNFANVAVPRQIPDFSLEAAQAIWGMRGAAPLAIDRATVEPIWRGLVARSAAVGLGVVAALAVSDDPELMLVTDTGRCVRPQLFDGRTYGFVVPAGARTVRLRSNMSRPSEAVGPFVDDRRQLGVLVGAVGVDLGHGRQAFAAAAFAATLDGWTVAEPGASHRWTTGDAAMPFDLTAAVGRAVIIDVEVIHAGPYLLQPATAKAA